jgi:hypothetical protein
MIKRLFKKMKRFEDKYIVNKTEEKQNPIIDLKKSSIHPKIVDFTFNLRKDT